MGNVIIYVIFYGSDLMKYIIDSDYHIHSKQSFCSRDELQTPQNILDASKKDGFKEICLTDHFWDEYVKGIEGLSLEQNFENIKKNLPLPQDDDVKFMFGCETDLDKRFVLGVSPQRFDCFDFIIIATTHLHLGGFTVEGNEGTEERAKLYVDRIKAVLDMDLPFEKIGFAHLTTSHITRGKNPGRYSHLDVIDLVSDSTFRELFKRIADKGSGVELNFDLNYYETDESRERSLRPYRIAKECGCKFYFGSDAHHPKSFENRRARFEKTVKALDLTQNDKFRI